MGNTAKKKMGIAKKYYVRKENGEIDYSHPYDLIKEIRDVDLYRVELDSHFGYMDANEKFVIPLEYDNHRINYKGNSLCNTGSWFSFFSETHIVEVYKDNAVGVVNNKGEKVVPCEFEDVQLFEISRNFVPVALKTEDGKGIVWGVYDIKKKRVSVIPQYEEIKREFNGYAPFRKNGKWGLVHCATGTEVVPAKYLLDFNVTKEGLAIAFLGGSWEYGRNSRYVDPEDCHVLVVNGINPAQVVVSGYTWIEISGPSVMKCRIGNSYKPKELDSFKIIKMPNYIAMIKNASYESGYLHVEEDGKKAFVKKWQTGCTSYGELEHAKYLSGGMLMAKSYAGENIPITNEMIDEIQKYISME